MWQYIQWGLCPSVNVYSHTRTLPSSLQVHIVSQFVQTLVTRKHWDSQLNIFPKYNLAQIWTQRSVICMSKYGHSLACASLVSTLTGPAIFISLIVQCTSVYPPYHFHFIRRVLSQINFLSFYIFSNSIVFNLSYLVRAFCSIWFHSQIQLLRLNRLVN